MLDGLVPLPSVPTIGTATNVGDGVSVSVSFTSGGIPGGSYTVLSTPGSITATGGSSPIVITGLTAGVSYTFKVKATNSTGDSAYSASSNAVTPVAPFVATGGTITTPGDGYKYHTFTGGGTFAVTSGSQPAAEVIVVAGGGSGWNSTGQGGGGGAGGLVYVPSTPFTPTGGNGSGAYTVTIGAGGPGSTNNPGNPSSFTGLTTAVAGGAGAGQQSGNPGGSGGGRSMDPFFSTGQGTPGQGYPGGAPDEFNNNAGGGGGAGGRSPDRVLVPGYGQYLGQSGGPGLPYFGTYYAGGGGGAQPVPSSFPGAGAPLITKPGIGGGGQGAIVVSRPNPTGGPYTMKASTSGTVNTGGGGGGRPATPPTAGTIAGGSGIVIVRYPA